MVFSQLSCNTEGLRVFSQPIKVLRADLLSLEHFRSIVGSTCGRQLEKLYGHIEEHSMDTPLITLGT